MVYDVNPQAVIDSFAAKGVFQTAVIRTRMAMALADATLPDCPLVYVNGAFEQLTGYASAEIIGRNCRFLQGPATDRHTVARIHSAIAERRDFEEEVYNYRKDGSGFWNNLYISPVVGPGDSLYFFASQIDITTRKSLLERQKVLLAELQHRTRNLLGTVQAITRQTLRRARTLEQFAGRYDGRLAALSRVQRLITSETGDSFDLRALIEAELQALGEPGARIEVAGPPVRLQAEAGQMVALALHELATNALKHGALAQEAGRLQVRWRIGRGQQGRRIRLVWRESGISLQAGTTSRKGYGRELIEDALPYQFNATTRFDLGQDGLRCLIELPIRDRQSAA